MDGGGRLVLFKFIRTGRRAGLRRRAIVMYPGHAVLQKFRIETRRNILHNGHKLGGFLLVEYEKDYSTVHGIDEQKCIGNVIIREPSELTPLRQLQCTDNSFKWSSGENKSRAYGDIIKFGWPLQMPREGLQGDHVE